MKIRLGWGQLVIAIVLSALALGSWWLNRVGTVPIITLSSKLRHDPDYIVDNFQNIVMMPQGQPQYELRGKQLIHYGDDGSSAIEEPYIIQYAAGQSPTHARAKRGYLPRGNAYIRLTGDVTVTHGRDPRSAGAEIRANEFTLELDKSVRKKTAR